MPTLGWARLTVLGLLTFLVSCGPVPTVAGGQPNAASRPADLLSFTSDYNDYVGLGQTKSFTPPTAKFVVEPGTQRDYLQLVIQQADEYWSIDLAAPTGHALEVGTYDNALGLSFRTDKTPVLMVYGDGRACSTSGSFTITQIAFDQKARLLALRATFVQRCLEPSGAGPLRGTLNYGSP